MPMHEIFGDPISTYSRLQALEDGALVDVSATAREAGITFPVALTRAVWESCVTVPPRVRGQDEAGRLWDVVWMLRLAIRTGPGGDRLLYRLLVRTAKGRRLVTLKSICGPSDDAEPVITVMLPEED